MISFAIKSLFCIGLLFLLVPLVADEQAEQAPAGLGEAAGLTFVAVQDFSGFCGRNPTACETGRELMSSLGVRAREASRLAFEFLDARYGDDVVPQSGNETDKIEQPLSAADIEQSYRTGIASASP